MMCVSAFHFWVVYGSGRDRSFSRLMLQFGYTQTKKSELKMIFQNANAKVFVSSVMEKGRVDTEI